MPGAALKDPRVPPRSSSLRPRPGTVTVQDTALFTTVLFLHTAARETQMTKPAKLQLGKETLRHLTEEPGRRAGGGPGGFGIVIESGYINCFATTSRNCTN